MSTSSLQIFIEYKVKQLDVEQYESVMEEILKKLLSIVQKIQWFVEH
ncbi:hypothetical protein KHA80_06965 [Anaerobacillus sp. HL2]|nr:hypothetical protein KHA80_06965 [Anaerobacillus sp. HL2]